MNKQIRVFALFLAMLMLSVLVFGCTSQTTTTTTGAPTTTTTQAAGETTTEPADDILHDIPVPIVDEPITLTIYAALDVMDFAAYSNLADNPVSQEIMRITGINLEFEHPPAGQAAEHFNVMLAGGEIADITFGMFQANYRGGAEQAYLDGLIIDPEPYIMKYAPYFRTLVLEHPLASKIVRSDSGFITGFGSGMAFDVEYGEGYVYGGPMVRKDLLQQAGLDVPVTIDDWTEMLRAFKELGVKIPYGWTHDGKNWDPAFSTNTFAVAWNMTSRSFYQDQGVLKYGPMQPDYRQYVDLLRMWYAEGLTNPDFATQTYLEHGKYQVQIGEVGAAVHHIYEYGSIHPEMEEQGIDMIPVREPVLTAGQLNRFKVDWGWSIGHDGKYISADCEYPEIAVMFIDWNYSQEARILSSWGIEGISYELDANGNPYYTEFYFSDEHINNRLYSPNVWNQNIDQSQNMAQYSLPVQQDGFRVWGDNSQYDLPNNQRLPIGFGALPAEDSQRYVEIITEVQTYFEEMFIKFVMGLEPMEKFDEFITTMESLGIMEATEIQQRAYDRFIAR